MSRAADSSRTVRAGDLGRRLSSFETGRTHEISVVRMSVPLILVPGIMGTRLAERDAGTGGEGEVVWDPDNAWWLAKMAGPGVVGSQARAKYKLLIGGRYFNENRLIPSNNDPAHNANPSQKAAKGVREKVVGGVKPWDAALTEAQVKRGWGGVHWASYGQFLWETANTPALADEEGTTLGSEGAGGMLETPVHAFGYNWTASSRTSGQRLAEYIRKTVQEERARGLECPGVVLITHSLGGIVARSACKLAGATPLVVAIAHAVQPVTGSPAAYWRMKAGLPAEGWGLKGWSDAGVALALGRDGQEVTALLGNMPGGLELLPSKHYEVYAEGAQPPRTRAWLHVAEADKAPVSLPRNGDPYREIYLQDKASWRLIEDPAWLYPIGKPNDGSILGLSADPSPCNLFVKRMQEVERFTDELGLWQHPRTATYWGTGTWTCGTVKLTEVTTQSLKTTPGLMDRAVGLYPPADRACAWWNSWSQRGYFERLTPTEQNGGTDWQLWDICFPGSGITRYPLKLMRIERKFFDDGDGTVPVGSARALDDNSPDPQGAAVAGVDHQGAFTNDTLVSVLRPWVHERVGDCFFGTPKRTVWGGGAGR